MVKLTHFLIYYPSCFYLVIHYFCKNYIATHHLTSLFNVVKRSRFALVQDVEVDFYPTKVKVIGGVLWKNYLNSRNLIFTNRVLAKKIGDPDFELVKGFSFVPFAFSNLRGEAVSNDVVTVIRDGLYKDPVKTLSVVNELRTLNVNVIALNASRQVIDDVSVIKNVSRDEFIRTLMKSRLFVCLSKWEGLGLPNIEAYISGCRVVTTEIPSSLMIKELNPGAVHIVDSDLAPHEIAKIIRKLISENSGAGASHEEVNIRNKQVCSCHEQWLEYARNVVVRGACL